MKIEYQSIGKSFAIGNDSLHFGYHGLLLLDHLIFLLDFGQGLLHTFIKLLNYLLILLNVLKVLRHLAFDWKHVVIIFANDCIFLCKGRILTIVRIFVWLLFLFISEENNFFEEHFVLLFHDFLVFGKLLECSGNFVAFLLQSFDLFFEDFNLLTFLEIVLL